MTAKKSANMSNARAEREEHVEKLFLLSKPIVSVWRRRCRRRRRFLLGTLRKDDVDENENAKKQIGPSTKNNLFARPARAFCILVHFFDVLVLTTT